MSARKNGTPNVAREAWLLMSDLVLDNSRRRHVSEELGMSFSRVRAIRRVAEEPRPMGELAEALGMDRPNVTVLVDDLESRGLVRREAHPTDRRAKLVVATAKGRRAARRADEILATPPAALEGLGPEDLEALRRILGHLDPEAAERSG
jgi:DNA-binding MarR family transcriptional regulator